MTAVEADSLLERVRRGAEAAGDPVAPGFRRLRSVQSFAASPRVQRIPKRAAAGAVFWWMVNSLFMGEQRSSNQRSLPGQASKAGRRSCGARRHPRDPGPHHFASAGAVGDDARMGPPFTVVPGVHVEDLDRVARARAGDPCHVERVAAVAEVSRGKLVGQEQLPLAPGGRVELHPVLPTLDGGKKQRDQDRDDRDRDQELDQIEAGAGGPDMSRAGSSATSRLKGAHGNLLIIWIVVGLARHSLGLQIKSNPRAASAKKRLVHVLGLISRRSGT